MRGLLPWLLLGIAFSCASDGNEAEGAASEGEPPAPEPEGSSGGGARGELTEPDGPALSEDEPEPSEVEPGASSPLPEAPPETTPDPVPSDPSPSSGRPQSGPSEDPSGPGAGDGGASSPSEAPSDLDDGCAPLPPPEGEVVELTPDDDLANAIASATQGTTLLLADGTYDLSGTDYVQFPEPGITLRSLSGDPERVVIDGGYQIGSLLAVRTDDITIAEVTLQRCQWHPIHVSGGVDADVRGTLIYRVRIVDPGQQAIKINSAEGHYADDGTIACSSLELTEAGRDHVTDCYTGGVDAHLARGWVVRDNRIEGFFCAEGLSEHGIHFWNSARDTLVERNLIIDCARGIGFGLGEGGNGTSRDYGDDACPGADFVGHYGGIVRNNFVVGTSPALFSSQFGFDSGVSLEQACGSVVAHNTVFASEEPFVSIEYRFASTDVVIANNLTSHRILERDGGQASLSGNLTEATAADFIDAFTGDLHLASDSAAVDQGDAAFNVEVSEDYDGERRGDAPDVGADER